MWLHMEIDSLSRALLTPSDSLRLPTLHSLFLCAFCLFRFDLCHQALLGTVFAILSPELSPLNITVSYFLPLLHIRAFKHLLSFSSLSFSNLLSPLLILFSLVETFKHLLILFAFAFFLSFLSEGNDGLWKLRDFCRAALLPVAASEWRGRTRARPQEAPPEAW